MNLLFTEIARKKTLAYWEGSFQHPFIKELQTGTLPMEKFRYYLIQDHYYLKHFSRLYKLVAQCTEILELEQQMQANSLYLAEGELKIRADFFTKLSIEEQELATTEIAPTAYHYVSHMYRQLLEANDYVAAASLLPCSWLYYEIGTMLQKANKKSPVPYYQQWIESYGGKEAFDVIKKECSLLNRLYGISSSGQQKQMLDAFVISAKMEFAFWEMAYQKETWPAGIIQEGVENG